jgi:hypothetical protein
MTTGAWSIAVQTVVNGNQTWVDIGCGANNPTQTGVDVLGGNTYQITTKYWTTQSGWADDVQTVSL